jgi:hypothetical protein
VKLRAEDSNLQPPRPERGVLPVAPARKVIRVATGLRTRDLRHGETALYRTELQPQCVPGEIRTPDTRIRNPVLYPLSYGDMYMSFAVEFSKNVRTKKPPGPEVGGRRADR